MSDYLCRIGIPMVLLGCLALPQDSEQKPSRKGHLDRSRAFYYPTFSKQPKQVLAETTAGAIDAATYLRYLATIHGTRDLEDLAFDILLAKECEARGLARSAPLLARSTAAKRFHESGRNRANDPDGSLQRKFATEALRTLRIDALAGARRASDNAALRTLFDRLFGVDGQRVRVKQILVSFSATRNRLSEAGRSTTDAEVDAAARERATGLRKQIKSGSDFLRLLKSSDDRTTRRLLRDPAQKAKAGFLEGYNYHRYGESFAKAVRDLAAGAVSQPVRTTTGYHLIQLVSRKITRLEDVAPALRKQLRRGQAKPAEIRALRKALLEKYRFRSTSGER